MTRVGIIDYGVGNLRSVSNALKHIGAESFVSADANELLKCDRIIFPGVGAFGYGMECLEKKRLDRVVKEAELLQIPLLGICVGMQLLFESSSEFGDHKGLGVIPGKVDRIKRQENDSTPLRLPNVGWAGVSITERLEGLAAKFLRGLNISSQFYFVHSYCAAPDGPNTIATSRYANNSFAAVVAKGSVIGTQFHPEKSGLHGLNLLKNFIE